MHDACYMPAFCSDDDAYHLHSRVLMADEVNHIMDPEKWHASRTSCVLNYIAQHSHHRLKCNANINT